MFESGTSYLILSAFEDFTRPVYQTVLEFESFARVRSFSEKWSILPDFDHFARD